MLRAVPGHVEQEEDVVVCVAVETQDVAAALEAVVREQARQGLEFDGGVFVEGRFLVDFQLAVQDPDDFLQDGEGVGEC